MIDTELKKKFAAFIKANLTSDSMSEEDIIWILDECDKGNKPTYDDFVKARRQSKVIESKDIHCKNCKHWLLALADDPCKNCLKLDTDQPLGFRHTCFEKKDIVDAMDRSMDFGPNMMRQEEFKIPDSEHIRALAHHTDSVVVGITKTVRDISDSVEKLDKDIPSIADCINIKIDKLMEAVESMDAKLDILDQRLHDLRQHQILKDMKYVSQVKPTKQNPFKIPEPKFNIGDIVVYKGYDTAYKITDRGYNLSQKIWTYDFERSDNDKIVRSSREDRIELAKKEEKKDILVREEKLNPDKYAKFKVGDKVKLKHGKVVYTVKKVHASKLMPSEKIFIRYTLSHKGRKTDQSEYESRITKA